MGPVRFKVWPCHSQRCASRSPIRSVSYDETFRLLRRFGALRGRQWQARLEQLLSERLPRGPDGRLQLTFELIYGHAFKARPKVKVSALSAVSVQDMRSMLQDPRGRP